MPQIELQQLSRTIAANPNKALDYFGISMNRSGNKLSSNCVLHDGDNPHALNIDLDKDRFICWTRGCNNSVYNTLIGFVRLCLSHKLLGWRSHGDRLYSFRGYN